uniref:Uncharacterized protein n=1 Tax=viral metagenome TaxID=1070528 RepID=A0A6H1ZE32_9ZZZZ
MNIKATERYEVWDSSGLARVLAEIMAGTLRRLRAGSVLSIVGAGDGWVVCETDDGIRLALTPEAVAQHARRVEGMIVCK